MYRKEIRSRTATFIWVFDNNKSEARATSQFAPKAHRVISALRAPRGFSVVRNRRGRLRKSRVKIRPGSQPAKVSPVLLVARSCRHDRDPLFQDETRIGFPSAGPRGRDASRSFGDSNSWRARLRRDEARTKTHMKLARRGKTVAKVERDELLSVDPTCLTRDAPHGSLILKANCAKPGPRWLGGARPVEARRAPKSRQMGAGSEQKGFRIACEWP